MPFNQSDPSIEQTIGIDGADRGKRRFKRWFSVVLLLLAMFSAGLWWVLRPQGSALEYRTTETVRGDLTVTVTATGNLAPTNEVEVGSELSGIVRTVLVDFNDQVRVGQPLARLDDTKFEAAVRSSRAALEAAHARLQQARATVREQRQNLSRLRQASQSSGGRLVSATDLEAAEAALERAVADELSAKASIEEAQAGLTADETDLAKTVIISPVKGIVLSRNVDPGQTVAASLQAPVLFTLAEDLTQMDLVVDVDEADVGRVNAGQPAVFRVDAYPDDTFYARIKQVRYGSQTTNGVVTYKTVLALDNPDLLLRPGMTATAEITVDAVHDALLVPNAALRFVPSLQEPATQRRGLVGMLMPRRPRNGSRKAPAGAADEKNRRVWVLKEERPVPVRVTTGVSDGVRTAITGGDLDVGAAVVVDAVSVKR